MPLVEDINVVLEDAMKYRLKLVKKNYSQERLIKVMGKNKESFVYFFRGADLRDNTDVRVTAGVDLFMNKELKHEIVMAMVDKGYIEEPRKAMELLDVKGLDEYMEEEFIDERQAERENMMMREGKAYPEVDEDDNHEVHFPKHNNCRKSADYESWPDESKEQHKKHMDKHKEFMGMAEAATAEETAPTEEVPVEAPVPAPPVPTTEEELIAAIAQRAQGGV